MLDIVTPYQNEPAPAVNAGVIDDCEPRLPSARAGSKPAATEPTNRPGDGADQGEYDQKSDEETHGERHFRPEQSLKHPRYSPSRCPTGRRPKAATDQWLTAPAICAAPTKRNNLITIADFPQSRDEPTILMVNGGLRAKPMELGHFEGIKSYDPDSRPIHAAAVQAGAKPLARFSRTGHWKPT